MTTLSPAHHVTPATGKDRPPVRLDVQGLRAVAVTLVVLAHCGVGAVAGGYVGVDVFFVVSGFLITSLLLRELAASGRVSVRGFYARRALRLLPAATLVVLVTLAGSRLWLSKVRFTEYAGDALASSLYAVNFRLAKAGTDYLNADSPPSPFQHFWSLAVEEQFYVVWPLLLALAWRVGRRYGRPLAAPAVVLAALCLVSYRLNTSLTAGSPSWGYFGTHARFWELGAGALLALGARRLGRLPGWAAAAMSWAGLAGVLLAAVRFDDDTAFPGRYALLPVLGTLLVLAGGAGAPVRYGAGLLLARRPAVRVGGLSYGWYLWHWPLLVIGPAALGRPAGVRLGLALSAVALGLAWVTLRLVEDPVRFHAAFRGRPRRALRLGGVLSAGAAVAALTASLFPPGISAGGPAPDLARELTAAPNPGLRLTQLLAASGGKLPSNLAPPLADVKPERSAVFRDGCHVEYRATHVPDRSCAYGDTSADKVVVVFGDSHAAQWFPALDRLGRERHWRVVSFTKASCKAADVTIISQGAPYTACDTWRQDALTRIAALHPDLVLVSAKDAGDPVDPERDLREQWAEGFDKTFAQLRADGARIAAVLDTPTPKSDAVDCAADHPLALTDCAEPRDRALRGTRRLALTDAARASGAALIDPAPWLCAPDGTCPVVAGNTMVYRDDNHIAEGFAAALTPVLGARLAGLMPG
ncbi:acyltransferase family protein [Streptomyces sp. NRRL F-5123]|uniref:acyltransferase family protein n=1 Tax=Streptomyces sp. NRRL F-5123 TaxID=1463856 RepID=UPI00099B99BC|nr:acyltransferase family protein [Streptomyces sp. NRRL F-5123]